MLAIWDGCDKDDGHHDGDEDEDWDLGSSMKGREIERTAPHLTLSPTAI